MTFYKTIATLVKESDPQIVLDALEELNGLCNEAAAETHKAVKAYYANVEAQKQKISERVEELQNRLTEYETGIEEQKRSLISATGFGDTEKLEEIKEAMKRQDVEIIQLTKEIEMLESAHVSGDKSLYEAVVDKNTVHDDLIKEYISAKKEVYKAAEDIIRGYERVKRLTRNFYAGGGTGPNMDNIRKHFLQGGN